MTDQISAFQAVLDARPELTATVSVSTLRRYRLGMFPKTLTWLLTQSELLMALAVDAEANVADAKKEQQV